MNKQDRKEIERAIAMMEEAKSIFENISAEESNKFDNLSEGLQASENGQKFESNVEALDEAVSNIEDVINNVQEL